MNRCNGDVVIRCLSFPARCSADPPDVINVNQMIQLSYCRHSCVISSQIHRHVSSGHCCCCCWRRPHLTFVRTIVSWEQIAGDRKKMMIWACSACLQLGQAGSLSDSQTTHKEHHRFASSDCALLVRVHAHDLHAYSDKLTILAIITAPYHPEVNITLPQKP
jgi:hypothetical protein